MTDRERFTTLLDSQQLVGSHAIVLLAGEDAMPRMEVATSLWNHGAAEALLVSGGVSRPPERYGAVDLHPLLLGEGVKPDAIILDTETQNTRDQAEGAATVAEDLLWSSMLIVASPYHSYRAFLTFLRSLQERNLTERVRLTVTSGIDFDVHAWKHKHSWFHKPKGVDKTRLELLELEFAKIGKYTDHVATYAEGIEYIRWWEAFDDAA